MRHINTNVNRALFNNFQNDPTTRLRHKTIFNYAAAAGILTIGLTYAAVPLYRMFCQVLIIFYLEHNSLLLNYLIKYIILIILDYY